MAGSPKRKADASAASTEAAEGAASGTWIYIFSATTLVVAELGRQGISSTHPLCKPTSLRDENENLVAKIGNFSFGGHAVNYAGGGRSLGWVWGAMYRLSGWGGKISHSFG